MSICNRYHISLKKNNLSWYLVYIIDEPTKNLNIEKILYPETIKNISQLVNVLEIHVYTSNINEQNIQNIFNGIKILIKPFNHVFDLIKYYDDKKMNIIYFANCTGCISDEIDINFDKFGVTYNSEYDNKYNNILEKYNIKEIIYPKILIIPYKKNNKIYFDLCKKFFDQINSSDTRFKTNLAMTLANNKLNNNIESINYLLDQNKFVIYNPSIVNYKDLYELIISNNNTGNYYNYYNDEYIFYPYFDFNLESQKIDVVNNFDIYNTNGFGNIEQNINPFNYVYKRFNNLLRGSFLKKKENTYEIPKIIHHIWVDNDSVSNYTNPWKKILKEPWEYKIWDINNINNFMENNRWKELYDKTSGKFKYLILSLSILEKYGGIIINSFCVPLKIIPDELLSNKFFISFDNEKKGTNISLNIMGSVCGPLNDKNNFKDPYVARKPFDGINNFFRSKKENTIDTFFQDLFIKINKINTTNSNLFDEVQTIFTNNSDIFIYPSYFFNLNSSIYPKKLINQTVLITLHKIEPINTRIKTDVTRNYTITHQGIINRLKENPKDRLKNINKL
ncbi:glycosyltransferase [Moumouvirus australiensis]|uniref:Glycosyltransferase n=1 Tax=Moumouvirus australiensis TaxID=2109587 RepID=A0A2P1ELD3_9VIRU|nr:glycosyltransferase [Moumouvirus australiensis]AVL94685.1 glycosyltransferase [Moumouvirus australiensis]